MVSQYLTVFETESALPDNHRSPFADILLLLHPHHLQSMQQFLSPYTMAARNSECSSVFLLHPFPASYDLRKSYHIGNLLSWKDTVLRYLRYPQSMVPFPKASWIRWYSLVYHLQPAHGVSPLFPVSAYRVRQSFPFGASAKEYPSFPVPSRFVPSLLHPPPPAESGTRIQSPFRRYFPHRFPHASDGQICHKSSIPDRFPQCDDSVHPLHGWRHQTDREYPAPWFRFPYPPPLHKA